MQVAKLFASLGFKVDLSGYNLFEKKLKDVRRETRSYAVSLKTIRTRLNHVSIALDGVNKKLDASKVKSANQRISSSASRLANAVERSAKSLRDVVTQGQRVHQVISQINTVLGKGVNGWRHYSSAVDQARIKLSGIRSTLLSIPTTRTITITQRNAGNPLGGAGQGGRGAGGSGVGAGAGSAVGAGFLGAGARDFFRSMTPATALAGGLVTAGYATKEVVKQGREMKKMEIIMTSATEGVDHFSQSMKYVRSEANRLGQDVYEMGMGFAKMQQAVKGKLSWKDRTHLFTGMAELSTTYGLSGDDQKGVWRAMTQMFTKGKIEAEEEGQLAERGLPAKEMIKEATRRSFKRQGKEFNDDIYGTLRKKGGLKMQDIASELGDITHEIASKNGALAEALQTSLVGQMRAKNAMREASKEIMDAGLDKLLFAMFEGLRQVIPYLKEFFLTFVRGAQGIKKMVDIIRTWISENPTLTAMLAGLIVMMRLFRFGIWGVASASLLMAGNFKKAMMLMWASAKRFLPIALLYGLFKFGEAYSDYLSGKDNWISILGTAFESLFWKIDYYCTKIRIAWIKTKNALTPDSETIANTQNMFKLGGGTTSLLQYGLMGGINFMRSSNMNMDTISNRSLNVDPTRNPMSQLNLQNDIYIDGVKQQTQYSARQIEWNGSTNVAG